MMYKASICSTLERLNHIAVMIAISREPIKASPCIDKPIKHVYMIPTTQALSRLLLSRIMITRSLGTPWVSTPGTSPIGLGRQGKWHRSPEPWMNTPHSSRLYESQPVCGETQAHGLPGVAVYISKPDLGIYRWHYSFDLISCHSSLSRNTTSSFAFPPSRGNIVFPLLLPIAMRGGYGTWKRHPCKVL
jgi:hypothetical protein